jgi:flagellar basal-body rod protein FlgB
MKYEHGRQSMAITFQSALGIHEQALLVREKRAEALANNLANVDTPRFKARDIDFRAVLQSQLASRSGSTSAGGGMVTTSVRHISTGNTAASAELLYREPLQPSIDGNTVDEQLEMAEFAKNALEFQASLTFLKGKFSGLMTAIRGE